MSIDGSTTRMAESVRRCGLRPVLVALALMLAWSPASAATQDRLVTVALDESVPLDQRRAACVALRSHATEQTAAALAPLLAEPEMSDHVRLVIEGIQSPVADLALIAALGRTDGEVRRGVIASLAARETGAAFAPLTELVTRTDATTAVIVLHALAAIARDARDANVIAALPLGEAEPLLIAQQEAFFSALARLARRGDNLDTVVIPFPKMQARTAAVADLAVGVMLRINPGQVVPQIVAMFQTGDPEYERRAASAIALLPDATARASLVARTAEIPAPVWPMLIAVLADQGGAEILPVVRAALSAADEPTKLAALDAMGRVGQAGDVPELLQLATVGGRVGRAALAALIRLPDRGADAALVAEFERADSPVRASLPDVMAARAIPSAMAVLLATATTTDRRLAAACYDAVGKLGDSGTMAELWERWTKGSAEERGLIEPALVAIARRDATGESSRLLTARAQVKDASVRALVIRLAGAIGDAEALAFLTPLVMTRKPDEAALRALVGWRGPAVLLVLQQVIEGGRLSAPLRAVAWSGLLDITRGYLRAKREEAMPWVDVCLKLATIPAERLRVVAAVAAVPHLESLAWLEALEADPDIATEATAAVAAMKARLAE